MPIIIAIIPGHTFNELGDLMTPELFNLALENAFGSIPTPIAVSDGGTGGTTIAELQAALGSTTAIPVVIAEGGTNAIDVAGAQANLGIPTALPVPIAEGGTNATDVATAQTNLGIPTALPVSIAEGGTGAIDAAAARTNLGINISDYILIRDVKSSGTDGGTFSSGSYQTRDLNEETSDVGGHASIAANQITLAAGTYECFIQCPAVEVDLHKARLQNISDATTTIIGSSAKSSDGGDDQGYSMIIGTFTIATSKTFEVQHRTSTGKVTIGFGQAVSFGDSEIYTIAQFIKKA